MENNIKLKQLLLSNNLIDSINNNMDYLTTIIPEIKDMVGFQHNHPHHHLDVWNHTLLALSLSPNDYNIRLALLLHDIGKPHSYQDEEVRHFRNHPEVSSQISKAILDRLQHSNPDYILNLISNHDHPIDTTNLDKSVDYYRDLITVQFCDAFAHNPQKLDKRVNYLKTTISQLKEYANANQKELNLANNIENTIAQYYTKTK